MKNSAICAFGVVSLIPAILMSILMQSVNFLVIFIAFFVCLAHLLILAFPLYFYLEKRKKLNIKTIFLSGVLISTIPYSILSILTLLSSARENGVSIDFYNNTAKPIYMNGLITQYGWSVELLNIGEVMVLGLFSAFIFWAIWRTGVSKY